MTDYSDPLILAGRHLRALEEAAALGNFGAALVYLTQAERSMDEVRAALVVAEANELQSRAARESRRKPEETNMTTATVTLKNGRNTLPQIGPGDSWECHINTGPNGDQPCSVDAYAGGPNLELTGKVSNSSGAIYVGSVLGPSATIKEYWNAKNPALNTIKDRIAANTDIVFTVTLDPKLDPGSYGGTADLVLGRR